MSDREFAVAGADELEDGEMKEVAAGDTKVLLARVGGQYHAVSPACPHYGAPLVEGALCNDRVVCPWHHACFNVTTGDLEEPPALDALTHYDLQVDDGRVVVRVPEETSDRRTPTMVGRDPDDERVFVILGGGAAGYAAAQTLREDGYTGRVLMVTREDRLPYDRPNLSKDYLHGHADPEWMPLRAEEFFAEHHIEVALGKEVTRVSAESKTISFGDGTSQTYDALLVATGGAPRKLPVPGSDLENVFLLRSFDDADAIIEAARRSSSAVVIGASFVGMEAAYSLRERGLRVTVVAPDSVPFEKTLGPEIGALFRRLHEAQGVSFRLGASVSRLEGAGKVERVVLDNGEGLEADMVVAGVGVRPATGFLEGVQLAADGGVIVDSNLRAADGLYAAGDIANFPDPRAGSRTRIEHWRTAQQQGRVAAHNMAGKAVEYDGVPFFWTRQFDAGLLYVGHAGRWDKIIYEGDVEAPDFLAFYVSDDRVSAVAGMNRDREMAAVEELMRLDRMPTPDEVRGGQVKVLELLRDQNRRGRKEPGIETRPGASAAGTNN
jgi:NADPH-dependent 2,4-dienoyl-CoA reductase/sulfur reductase-like enzyme/nitrite reductase/ring-hydroxylating ferredoxin subunit